MANVVFETTTNLLLTVMKDVQLEIMVPRARLRRGLSNARARIIAAASDAAQ